MRRTICEKLDALQAREGITIVFAVESGSRAWGFPSPDSDYDVRFVYTRPVEWYLSITPGRDVVELPLEGDLDINGWDLKKALGLILKPNPVLLEWLSSPIRYIWDGPTCDRLIQFSKTIAHNRACLHHYVGLGENTFRTRFGSREEVALKKYFYLLRPALALRWVRMHPDIIPPMNFRALMEAVDLPRDLTDPINQLLEKKRITKEMGVMPRIDALERFAVAEFAEAKAVAPTAPDAGERFEAEANDLFRALITSPGNRAA
ncbi:MAG: nucleotidyltransferase domain-containing protein [Pseudomonadota bacterium]